MQTQTFAQNVKTTFFRILKIVIGVSVVVGIAVFSFYYWGIYDEGVRAGTILRISKKGMLFKTYEGQLNVQTFGALKGVNPIMESFDFSVESDETQVIKDLEEVALSGERVNLRYIERHATFPWRGDTKYFITRIERLGR